MSLVRLSLGGCHYLGSYHLVGGFQKIMHPSRKLLPQAASQEKPLGSEILVLSASLNRRSEDVGILAVIVPELELCDIEREVLFADFVEAAHTWRRQYYAKEQSRDGP